MERYETEQANEEHIEGLKCLALADELFSLKEHDTPLSFVDIVIALPAKDLLAKLQAIETTAQLLRDDDKQLAFEPELEVKKGSAKAAGVNLRVWRWYDQRRIDISFWYLSSKKEHFSEHMTLDIFESGKGEFGSHVYLQEYAEMGYEGHDEERCSHPPEQDIASFGSLVAEAVGDEPQTITMYQSHQLSILAEEAASPAIKAAIEQLVEKTWPAQAYSIMSRRYIEGVSLAKLSKSNDPIDEKRVLDEIASYIDVFTI